MLRFRGGDSNRTSSSSVDSFRIPHSSKTTSSALASTPSIKAATASAVKASDVAVTALDASFNDEQRSGIHADKMTLIYLHKIYDLVVSFPGDDGAYCRYAGKTKVSYKEMQTADTPALLCAACDMTCHENCLDFGKDNKPDPNTSCVALRGRTTCKHCNCGSKPHYHAKIKLELKEGHLDDEIGHLKHKGTKWHAMSATQAKGVVTRALYSARAKAEKDFRALIHSAPSASVASELAAIVKLIATAKSQLQSMDSQREVRIYNKHMAVSH